jgi:hypothetical protein
MSEDRVLDALRALREADAERGATPELEARLVQGFRRRKRRGWTWAAVGIAAGLAGLAAVLVEFERPAPRLATVAPPAPAPIVASAPPVTVAAAPSKPRPMPRKQAIPLREVVTEFYPLMDVPPPFERGELVRTRLPTSALRRAGFAMEGSDPDDPVEVEVLMGGEGLARAIRFVSYQ